MIAKLNRWARFLHQVPNILVERLDLVQQALGRIEARQTAAVASGAFENAEFKVSSQWGEDGIIEHLVRNVVIEHEVFVEFGVQDYREANTRFLLTNRNWAGLVIDGSAENIAFIKQDSIYWRFNLKAECAFLTRENIDASIAGQGISGDIGLLSIDIDGNDYWVWEAISCVSPRIVVAEYNALFGPAAQVSVPYESAFQRNRAHYSNLYWGCSLAALVHLGQTKGYVLVGCNGAGNNAFFVRMDVLGQLPAQKPLHAFRPAKFRESRNVDGSLSYLDGTKAIEAIGHLPLINVTNGSQMLVGELRRL
jgi:hypothetical protein